MHIQQDLSKVGTIRVNYSEMSPLERLNFLLGEGVDPKYVLEKIVLNKEYSKETEEDVVQ